MAKNQPRRAALLFTGTELLRGKQNTYPPLLAAKLAPLGFAPSIAVTLPDCEASIAAALKNALKDAELVVLVGGLGPTFDDLSREGAARALKRPLVFVPRALREIEARCRRFARVMPESNKRQAYALKGAQLLKNPNGTAPGQLLEARVGGRKRMLVLLPGPLREWEPMFDGLALPRIKKHFPAGGAHYSAQLALGGIGESMADEKIRPVLAQYPDTEFTILSAPGDVKVYASGMAADAKAAAKLAAQISAKLKAALGASVYSETGEPLAHHIGKLLKRRRWTLAAAESCTGGQVSDKITGVAGSSEYFKGAAVVYSNELKMKLLGVKKATLAKHGAVSQECAEEMAEGARKRLGADCAVAITGIAGPGGGSKEKPVGLVYIAVSVKGRPAVCKRFCFVGARESIKSYSCANALQLLRINLES